MSIYSDKSAHVQVVINCRYSIAQMCSWEDIHDRLFMRAVVDDIMSQNELETQEALKKQTFQYGFQMVGTKHSIFSTSDI